MKITVVTVTYNCVNSIEKTIKSVIQQKYQNKEYLIIDNCSDDGTLAIMQEYAQKYSDILRIVSEPDTGIYNAMNKGISMATGDYIHFLNAGDEYVDQNVLSEVVESINDNSAVYYGYVTQINETNSLNIDFEKEAGTFIEKLCTGKMPCHQAIFAPVSLLRQRGYSEEYKIRADYEWVVYSLNSGVRFSYIPRLICNFDVGVSGELRNYLRTQQETQKILANYKDFMNGNDTEDWRGLSVKHFAMYQLLVKWVRAKQQGVMLENYFKKHQLLKIAIYGMSDLGQLLYGELKNTEVDIKYCIDRKVDIFDGVKVENDIRQTFDGVDAIVITALWDYETIYRMLKEQGNQCKIVSILDVICEELDKGLI